MFIKLTPLLFAFLLGLLVVEAGNRHFVFLAS